MKQTALGVPLRLPRCAEPPPERLLDTMRFAKVEGARLVGRFWSIGTGRGFLHLFHEKLRSCVAKWTPYSEAGAHAVRAAFIYGFKADLLAFLSDLPLPMRRNVLRLSALAQQELTLAALKLPPNLRQSLLDRTDILQVNDIWTTEVAGAVTAARVVYAMLTQGLTVRLSSIELDAFHAGDLLVHIPGNPMGLYTQVTGDGHTEQVQMYLLRTAPIPGVENEKRLKAVWDGSRYIASALGSLWMPFFIKVGMQGMRPSDLEHPLLMRRLTEFLSDFKTAPQANSDAA